MLLSKREIILQKDIIEDEKKNAEALGLSFEEYMLYRIYERLEDGIYIMGSSNEQQCVVQQIIDF